MTLPASVSSHSFFSFSSLFEKSSHAFRSGSLSSRPEVCYCRDPSHLERCWKSLQEADPKAPLFHQDGAILLSPFLFLLSGAQGLLSQESTSYEVKMDGLDLLAELLSRFGALMVPFHQVCYACESYTQTWK